MKKVKNYTYYNQGKLKSGNLNFVSKFRFKNKTKFIGKKTELPTCLVLQHRASTTLMSLTTNSLVPMEVIFGPIKNS